MCSESSNLKVQAPGSEQRNHCLLACCLLPRTPTPLPPKLARRHGGIVARGGAWMLRLVVQLRPVPSRRGGAQRHLTQPMSRRKSTKPVGERYLEGSLLRRGDLRQQRGRRWMSQPDGWWWARAPHLHGMQAAGKRHARREARRGRCCRRAGRAKDVQGWKSAPSVQPPCKHHASKQAPCNQASILAHLEAVRAERRLR